MLRAIRDGERTVGEQEVEIEELEGVLSRSKK